MIFLGGIRAPPGWFNVLASDSVLLNSSLDTGDAFWCSLTWCSWKESRRNGGGMDEKLLNSKLATLLFSPFPWLLLLVVVVVLRFCEWWLVGDDLNSFSWCCCCLRGVDSGVFETGDSKLVAEEAKVSKGEVRRPSLSSLTRLGRRPRRDASRDIPTAKHFFRRQNWQLLRLKGVISHCWLLVHWWFMPWVMQRRKNPFF